MDDIREERLPPIKWHHALLMFLFAALLSFFILSIYAKHTEGGDWSIGHWFFVITIILGGSQFFFLVSIFVFYLILLAKLLRKIARFGTSMIVIILCTPVYIYLVEILVGRAIRDAYHYSFLESLRNFDPFIFCFTATATVVIDLWCIVKMRTVRGTR